MKDKIGELRQRVTFQKPDKVDDGHGGSKIVGWDDVATVWAKVEPLTGREYFFAHQIRNVVTHRVKIRYRTDFSEEMRIKLGERRLLIESIIDLNELHRFLEIICREEK